LKRHLVAGFEAQDDMWRRALKRRERAASKTAATFVPVQVVSEPPTSSLEKEAIEIALPGGVVVRVRSGFDTQALRQVLAGLAESR
jgi:hypothetical protein